MRVVASALLLGTAIQAAAAHDQIVLGIPESIEDIYHDTKEFVHDVTDSARIYFDDVADSVAEIATATLDTIEEVLGEMPETAKGLWQEMSLLVPGFMEKAQKAITTAPKSYRRRPDSEWDHIVKGADIQNLWTETNGVKRRVVDGHLEDYNLRIKSVDPSKLGVDTVKQYSGYLDAVKNDKHLFYWFFESRNDPKNDPVVLWLNGGPGCSSLLGLFMELGPASINEKLEVTRNPYSWNNNASVIFIDQPVNTGFSYSGGKVHDTLAASKDIYALLTEFFHQFPEYSTQDFHITGESYAGHYIPVMAKEILSHATRNINLKSIAIGNGLTDPLTQYAGYRPMACGDDGSNYGPILSESECQSMDNALPRCQSLTQSCYDSGSAWSCVPSSIYCQNALLQPYTKTGQNVYDIREKCKDQENLCYPQTAFITEWLNKAEVQAALGVEVQEYEGCNRDVNLGFLMKGDWNQPFHLVIPGVIEKVPVLVYAGDADFICNWIGNKAWTKALEWPGQKDFNAANDTALTVGDHKYGEIRTSGNFSFMRIYQAGHMVPLNQPEASLDFFNRWIGGEWNA